MGGAVVVQAELAEDRAPDRPERSDRAKARARRGAADRPTLAWAQTADSRTSNCPGAREVPWVNVTEGPDDTWSAMESSFELFR